MKPVAEMTNEEIYVEMQEVSKVMSEFYRVNNLKDRNALVPRYRELSRAYDWGFKVRDHIETIAWQNRWMKAKIIEHDAGENMYYVRNDKGWEIGVQGNLIRKIEKVEVKILPPDPAEEYEQLALDI